MQLGHLATAAGPTLFAADASRWVDVPDALPGAPRTLDALVRADADWLPRIQHALATRGTPGFPDAPLAPAVTAPGMIVAIGLNYADHCREFGVEPPTAPVVFAKHPSSLAGHGADVVWDTTVTDAVDWEVELGVVIGAAARDVSPETALDYVFGYTIVNDVTARDIQKVEQQWVRSKSLDTFCPVGPVVVPAASVPDPQDLAVRARVNGVAMQDSSTKQMIFSVAEIISVLSRSFTLQPGDLIATGTPLGVGAFRTPPVRLADGDVMELEIEGIGTLVNTCRTTTGGTR
ncbi:fumarylacetoacetate hydrolase family protein [Cellulomonas dongxiuzhuiae]|uniref:fumarylacetoacetate hydrolase family protein n=1 Tax=Cellulomonas dongxiuzhuiae TaxID=2819979 RepID=UPI001AAEF0D0|nr:fumarylacetoacetate hydrolase family protein [Cellulomonas dongxiuzhuiae]MBO3089202.1 fumarylacetoacetate hydrolase family protein [Cellulomonas dongxiuzhuiae]